MFFADVPATELRPAYFMAHFEPEIRSGSTAVPDYWVKRPLIKHLHDVARQQGRDGIAFVRCSVKNSGRLNDCDVTQLLGGEGFRNAALRLSRRFLLKPHIASQAQSLSARVTIRILMCRSETCDPPEYRYKLGSKHP